ncbi:hypothetical protein, partial [Staphylococcus aureus]|uniref:hypothetical protein n=1 Tax=Staphylococcus aureus TaxID=1280 RepID=UPI0037D9E7B9
MPVNKDPIPKHLPHTIPLIQQLFIHITHIQHLQNPFFLPTKQLHFYSTHSHLQFYFTTLSPKTILYKPSLPSHQIKKLYTHLSH